MLLVAQNSVIRLDRHDMSSQTVLDSFIYVGAFAHSISLQTMEFIEMGTIAVSNGRIVVVENTIQNLKEIQNRYEVSDDKIYKLEKGQFLIPGFIDTHIHGPQYPNCGLGYDLTLLDWLKTHTFPLEKKFSNSSFATKIYNSVVKRTLANGTTTACYFATIHKESSWILANCMKILGQRGFVGKVNMNKNTPPGYGETFEESKSETIDFIKKMLTSQDQLVKPILTPRFALSCDMELMKVLGELSSEFNIPIQTHLSENLEEIKKVSEEFPDCQNYVDVYNRAGLINKKTILAHGIYLNKEEMELIKKNQAAISHCASSNTLLKSGICPVRRYLDAGIKVCLGTDCSGGYSCSMLECIRQTLMVSIQAYFNQMGKNLTLEEVFYLATLGGAEALSLQDDVGNFLPKKYFDGILVDLRNNNALDIFEEYSLNHLFEKFIYLGDDRVMKKVFVGGRIVKQC